MSTSITIPASALMLAPPALLLAGGLIVAVALRGFLTTGIEVARLNATNDDKTARWLWLRGYRKTPHAGPDLTDEPEVLALSDRSHADEQADHTDTDRPHWWATVVAFVVLAPVAFARRQLPVLVEWVRERFKSDEQLAAEFIAQADKEPWVLYDEDDLRAKGATEQELSMLRRGFVPIFAAEQVNDLFPQNLPEPELPPLVLDPDDEVALKLEHEAWKAANPPTNQPYIGRHWSAGTEHTGIFPQINAKVPAQRTGDDL